MADTLKIDSVKMQDILGTGTVSWNSDERLKTQFSDYSDQAKREVAVTAVLEIIKAKAGAEGGGRLSDQMKNLNFYTKCILAAMNGENSE